MATIEVDFNAQNVGSRVRLTTLCSQESLARTGAKPGDWVWLTDGELRAGGVIEEDREGLRARVAWETLEDIIPEGDELRSREKIQEAQTELPKLLTQPERNYRSILRILPIVEDVLPPGQADALRSMVCQALGYPELALLAIEDALQEEPGDPSWTYVWLKILIDIDLERAVNEAEKLVISPSAHASVLAACSQALAAFAQQNPAREAQLLERILELTDRYNTAPGREFEPIADVSSVHQIRGSVLSALGDPKSAAVEFERAIASNPSHPNAYAARGLETYPSDQAISDLQRAIELGVRSYWPAYYLAHHFIREERWEEVERFTAKALKYAPPKPIEANLLEWLAIAAFVRHGDRETTRRYLAKALELAPEQKHLHANLQILDHIGQNQAVRSASWALVRDGEGRAWNLAVKLKNQSSWDARSNTSAVSALAVAGRVDDDKNS